MCRVFAMLGHLQFNWLWALCTQCAFSSIQFTHESRYIHGCRYALYGTKATLDGSQCLQERIQSCLSCIYSWHVQFHKILHMHKNIRKHYHRMRATNWWFLHHFKLHIIEQSEKSSKIYRQHRTEIILFGAHLLVWLAYHHRRITAPMFESASTVTIYPSRVERVSVPSLLHRLEMCFIF